ncbi:alpha/beta fold hydrolase [Amycolatopsis suaedae]|uniref:Alpha/beta fold hydrolase n=1 Tax=Amycolatopsis suaedae TaxID=2510978 RepID=A0A4V2ELP3_9PSEU|nr:alpha/beta fold hydrolase [Amycolatopsis suaedae]RZQ62265.1 alpha/beta fold hydrolase [Amycolatopsis suaedae]
MKSRTLKRLVTVSSFVLVISGVALPGAAEEREPSTEKLTFVGTEKLSKKYLGQELKWSEDNCSEADKDRRKDPAFAEIAYRKVECAKITVPLNYLEPDRYTLELYALRVRAAMSEGERARPLFVNRGGPGGTASDYAMQVADRLPALSETHDIIGIDPRGIGQSSPVPCSSKKLDPENYRPSARVDDGTDWSCVIKYRQAAFLGTENVARDFDLVRHLLGEPAIDYYGASYGTELGRVYQALFPTRSGRFILDSNSAVQGARDSQAHNFPRRAEQLKAWLARHDDKYGLGESQKSVEESYAAILAGAAAGRLGGLSKDDIDEAWESASYADLAFSGFAEGLADAKRYLAGDRNVTLIQVRDKLFSASAQRDIHSFYEDGAGGILVRMADWGELAVNSDWMLPQVFADSRKENSQGKWRRALMSAGSLADITPFGDGELRMVPGISDIRNSDNFPFALMLQAEYDPATTWEEGLATLELLPNSKLVAIQGSGTHGVFRGNNPCSDVIAYRYLQRGERPLAHVVCPGVPLPGDDKVYPGEMITKWQEATEVPAAPVLLSPQPDATVKPGAEVTGELRREGDVAPVAETRTVSMLVDGQQVQTVKTSADGKWRAKLPENLAVGRHKLSASFTDSAGGRAAESAPVEFTIEAADASALEIKQTHTPNATPGQDATMTVTFSAPAGMPVLASAEQRFVAPTGFRFTGVATHVLDGGGQGSALRTRVEDDGRVLVVLDPIRLNVDEGNRSSADHRTVVVRVSTRTADAGTHADGTVTVGSARPGVLAGTINKQAQPRG